MESYFTCNGSAFNKLQYPKLAEAYPALQDLTGSFLGDNEIAVTSHETRPCNIAFNYIVKAE